LGNSLDSRTSRQISLGAWSIIIIYNNYILNHSDIRPFHSLDLGHRGTRFCDHRFYIREFIKELLRLSKNCLIFLTDAGIWDMHFLDDTTRLGKIQLTRMYVYIYMCVCVRVCTCTRARACVCKSKRNRESSLQDRNNALKRS